MSEMALSLRQLIPQDGQAYAEVLAASPDTGTIGTAVRFEIDPYQALISLHKDTVGVVAQTPGYDGIIGSGLIRFGQSQWEGEVRPLALLNTLVVHPDYRRQGVASQLARWRQQFAFQRQGEDGVIWAVIQRNNIGSEQTARKWAKQFLSNRLMFVPLRMRTSPPRRSPNFDVRPPRPDEISSVAEHLNNHYRDYNLYSPETQTTLAVWLAETPFDTPFRHYRVVTDEAGRLLAGIAISENHRLRTLLVIHMPAVLQLLNRFFKVVPASGELREIGLNRLWYAPGEQRAARYLLKMIRWEWREKGTSMILYTDVRAEAKHLFPVWEQAGGEILSIALSAPVNSSENRLFYYA